MVDSKSIRKFILNPTNDLDELLLYLDKDFKVTVEGIFNALFPLLKLYDQNKGRVDYLIGILEQLVEVKTSNELGLMLGPITDLDNKLNKLPLKNRIMMNVPYQRIRMIVDKIEKKSLAELDEGKLKYLEYLVFQNRDIDLISSFLEHHKNVLNIKNRDGNDIIEEVLKIYLYLNEKDMDKINYYYHVLLIFLGSDLQKNVLKNKKKYYLLIKESKIGYKEHIIKVLELLVPNFKVNLSEIEDKYQVNFNFHDAIKNEVNNLKISHDNHCNFLYQDCITIDGDGAECLDDALYIEKNIDGTYTLYVHIIDIPSIVPYYSVINEEARKRIKTWYLRQNKLLLYPESISNYMGSILEDEVRNVISYIFLLDDKFNLIEDRTEIKLGFINSRHRLTYGEVDNMYESQFDGNLTRQINWLSSFAKVRRKTNIKKEKYRQYENLINMQMSHESLKIDHSIAANIVHEAMILVNYTAAKRFKELSYPYIYRKVVIPSSDYIDKQIQMIKQMDSSIMEDKVFLNQLKESAMQSMYCERPEYHSGLRMECYSHSTSPARRYPDAFCQYLVHDLLINSNEENILMWDYRVKELVKYLNNKEREVERFASEYNYLSYKKLIKSK